MKPTKRLPFFSALAAFAVALASAAEMPNVVLIYGDDVTPVDWNGEVRTGPLDIGEQTDVAKTHPKIAKEMSELLEKMKAAEGGIRKMAAE